MGSILKTIFGGPSKQSSQSQSHSEQQSSALNANSSDSISGNLAFPMISEMLGGQLNTGNAASGNIAALLGLGGDIAGQNQAFQNFRNSTGYQFGLDAGSKAITGNAATRGLLNSGSTLKALNSFGQNYANTQFQNYLNPLQALIGSGNQAAGIIGNTGQVSSSASRGFGTSQSSGFSDSTSSSKGTGEKKGILGPILQAVAAGG